MASQYDEKQLTLSNGRVLAYSHCGNTSSKRILIFFHGMFGVGAVSEHTLTPSLIKHDVHYIAPTLPGWGNSDGVPDGEAYHIGLARSVTELLRELGVDEKDEGVALYVSGGSYGTVPAQMLYGASYEVFPHGRRMVGCMLGAPLSPFRHHKEYSKKMAMPTYVMLGLSKYIPFHLVERMAKMGMEGRMKRYEDAKRFLGETVFDKMDEGERRELREWEKRTGREEGAFAEEMTVNAMKSVSRTWAGFMGGAGVLHSDWGFHPARLDAEHAGKRMLIVTSRGDDMAPMELAEWLHGAYRGSVLRVLEGGHLALLYEMDSVWDALLA